MPSSYSKTPKKEKEKRKIYRGAPGNPQKDKLVSHQNCGLAQLKIQRTGPKSGYDERIDETKNWGIPKGINPFPIKIVVELSLGPKRPGPRAGTLSGWRNEEKAKKKKIKGGGIPKGDKPVPHRLRRPSSAQDPKDRVKGGYD
ncbi:unnamed protein product [Cuscuta europaea]|uniref:Uncharacterized protein n=1 Tax=Cuscuta europaea TaxID=41803 RepID=A0A9P1EMQ2_CUSEU|nr:unnamed protein product [Cuscuta europaea]